MAEILGPDILLNDSTHDLLFEDGDLVFGVDVAQAVKINLLTFAGEWFLDPSLGVPYVASIFKKTPNLDLIRTLLQEVIISTPGVGAITEFTLDFNETTRDLSVVWKATTDESEIGDVLQVSI